MSRLARCSRGGQGGRTARSVWSARSLLPLSLVQDRAKAPASWAHSKRFAPLCIAAPRSDRGVSLKCAFGSVLALHRHPKRRRRAALPPPLQNLAACRVLLNHPETFNSTE